jgi:uncharacterized membrane protein YadS
VNGTEKDEKRIAARHKRLGIWCGLGIALASILTLAMAKAAPGSVTMSADERTNALLSLLLRPYFLIPCVVLVSYGFVESLRARADWKIDRIPLYVFLMCLASVVAFISNLIRLRPY